MKYSIIVVVFGCFYNSLANANTTFEKFFKKTPKQSLIYHFSVHLLNLCDLNLKRIIIYNNVTDRNTFSAIAQVQPQTAVTLLSNLVTWKQVRLSRVDDVKVDAVVLVLDMKNPWRQMQELFYEWPFNRNCIVYLVPVPVDACDRYWLVLEFIMRFYFHSAYFFCFLKRQFMRVFTHDPYGDTRPPYWNRRFQEHYWGKEWTVYERWFHDDISEMCQGFNFNRTDPTNKISPILGLGSDDFLVTYNKTQQIIQDDEEVEQYLYFSLRNQVRPLKKLLNLTFELFVVKTQNTSDLKKFAYFETSVDAIIHRKYVNYKNLWNSFYPTKVEPYVILSHSRGFMTPSEKIAKFYGKWTLSSLILILIVTFAIIWFLTRNTYLASFDIIRLLINAEIIVPINTRPQKIFFSVVFLYFLVIHATFSGHLAEFLTKIEYRPNIETIDELKDPKIKKIFMFGYRFDLDYDVLNRKSLIVLRSGHCSRMKMDPDSVCIAPFSAAMTAWLKVMTEDDFCYVSRNTFGSSFLGGLYRPGFPLHDKINWAFMYLVDTGNAVNDNDIITPRDMRELRKYMNALFVQFRNITIKDLYFAFGFLIVGNCCGFVCFLFEIGFKLFSDKRRSNRTNYIPTEFN